MGLLFVNFKRTLISVSNPENISFRDSIKQFFVRLSLQVIRILVRVKPHVLGLFRSVFGPFRKVGRFLMSAVFVPAYRVFYVIKKRTDKAWRPAKNRFMVFVTNRYAVHVTMGVIALVVIGVNVQTTEVRAETFGERSLMYSIATGEDTEIIEETKATAVEITSVSYRETTGIASYSRGIDFIGGNQAPVAILGGGALASPTISEGADSTAPRTDIESYVVQGGDTLSTIASQFGISLNTLLWANDLTVRSVLKPGMELTILPTSGVKHTVSSGDSLTSIADEYDADEEEIIKFNRLASADDIVIGEDLIVPGGEIAAPAPVTRPTSVASVFTPTTTTSTIPTTTSDAEPTTTGSGSMIWPTDLYVITQYYGWSHTGVDIDCKFTNHNYAADDGIVQYAGWKGGYGYTVEINHGNGLVTRYGHHASLDVVAGQQVTKGQSLGVCGTTGRSTGTHLHFEVIVNGAFRNPLEYIR